MYLGGLFERFRGRWIGSGFVDLILAIVYYYCCYIRAGKVELRYGVRHLGAALKATLSGQAVC